MTMLDCADWRTKLPSEAHCHWSDAIKKLPTFSDKKRFLTS
jgi:hypothetical protein